MRTTWKIREDTAEYAVLTWKTKLPRAPAELPVPSRDGLTQAFICISPSYLSSVAGSYWLF